MEQEGVRLSTKRRQFRSNVVGALLTGLECEVLTPADLAKLERCQVLLGRWDRWLHAEIRDNRRQRSNREVRQMMNISTVESELQAKRLKWWQQIITKPYDNGQLLAALFGRAERERREGKDLGNLRSLGYGS